MLKLPGVFMLQETAALQRIPPRHCQTTHRELCPPPACLNTLPSAPAREKTQLSKQGVVVTNIPSHILLRICQVRTNFRDKCSLKWRHSCEKLQLQQINIF